MLIVIAPSLQQVTTTTTCRGITQSYIDIQYDVVQVMLNSHDELFGN